VKTENLVVEKSYQLAISIVRLYQHLSATKKEFVLSKQLLRSGTSIGANVEEAVGAQSRADFIAKMSIAYKEARETDYWLRLLRDTDYLNQTEFENMQAEAKSVCRIIASILISLKSPQSTDSGSNP